MDNNIMNKIIGIDFGTTNTCISYISNDNLKIIELDGKMTIPTKVIINDISIYNIKRLIGVKYNDYNNNECLKGLFKSENYTISVDKNSEDIIFKIGDKEYYVGDLIKIFFKDIYEKLIIYFNKKENFDIIITVPAYFNDIQRCILKDCVESCNFNIIKIINEPTAAGIFYNDIGCIGKYVVFDIGGGTIDLSLIEVDYEDNIYNVKNVIGDNFLGGEDITDCIYSYVYKNIKNRYPEYNIRLKDEINMRRKCEKIKKNLSFNKNAKLVIELGDNVFCMELSRIKMYDICSGVFNKIKRLVESLIKTTCDSFDFSELQSVIFVGGSSRIPYFEDMFKEYFGKNIIINKKIDPDTCVSLGASKYGNKFLGENNNCDLLLLDVIPITLGVEIDGGIMSPIISKNSIIPISRSKEFINSIDNDDTIIVNVYQGERKYIKDNEYITSFELRDNELKKYKKGELKIVVKFDVDENGMIVVSGEIKLNNKIIKGIESIKRINNKRNDDLKIEMEKLKDVLI